MPAHTGRRALGLRVMLAMSAMLGARRHPGQAPLHSTINEASVHQLCSTCAGDYYSKHCSLVKTTWSWLDPSFFMHLETAYFQLACVQPWNSRAGGLRPQRFASYRHPAIDVNKRQWGRLRLCTTTDACKSRIRTCTRVRGYAKSVILGPHRPSTEDSSGGHQ